MEFRSRLLLVSRATVMHSVQGYGDDTVPIHQRRKGTVKYHSNQYCPHRYR